MINIYSLKIKIGLCIIFFSIFFLSIKINENILKLKNKPVTNINDLIEKLNLLSKYREPKNYLFSDLFTSKFCFDKNAYYIFEYYLNKNYEAYYLINSESYLYFSLLKQNKTKNLILYNGNENIYDKMFPYLLNAKIIVESYINQKDIEHYIEHCSLLITDFSSLCFDFFVQNKPVLFYFIDYNDNINFFEKEYYKKKNDYIYFGNAFDNQEELIEKIKYYIEKKFQIEPDLKTKYDSLFFQKKDIIIKISNFIEKIISKP